MIKALQKSRKPVPNYLNQLAHELSAMRESAVFSMYCFWTGEVRLGNLDGVLTTMPGFLGGREVVEVTYDPSLIPYSKLLNIANQQKCATKVFTRNNQQQATAHKLVGERAERNDGAIRPDREPKYQLIRSPLKYLPMTPMQQTKVNAAYGQRKDYTVFLSPRQKSLLQRIRENPTSPWPLAIGQPFESAWANIK